MNSGQLISMSKRGFTVEFVYTRDYLATDQYETQPKLFWWTSASRRWHAWSELSFEYGSDVSNKSSVFIQIDDTDAIRTDDTLRVEAIVKSPNYAKVLAGSKAGSDKIYLKTIYKTLAKTGTFKKDMQLRLNTSAPISNASDLKEDRLELRGLLKGKLVIKIKSESVEGDLPMNFASVDHFGMLEENMDYLAPVLNGNYARSIAPFEGGMSTHEKEEINRRGGIFMPSKEILKEVPPSPLWINEAAVVHSMFFWVDYTRHEPDERFYQNLSKIVLERYRVDRSDYIKWVDTQFSSTGETISVDFLKACEIMADMVTILPTRLPYIGDFTYLQRRKTGSRDPQKKSIESFHDAMRLMAGDCEDDSALIHYIARGLEIGQTKNADLSVSHKIHGGWTDPLLDSMQRIAHIYVGCGQLGTVTSKFLEKIHGVLPIIGSEKDNNAEIGAHMWWEWIPAQKFENLINATRKTGEKFSIYSEERTRRMPWESKLPWLVCEGTGYLTPLIAPVETYYTSEEDKKNAILERGRVFSFLKNIFKSSSLFKDKSTFQKIAPPIKDQNQMRISTFYRKSTKTYTDRLMREGMNVGEFTWTQIQGYHKEGFNERWTYGVDLRNKLVIPTNSEDQVIIGLTPTPGYTKSELDYTKSALRQQAPHSNPEITRDIPEIEREVQEMRESLARAGFVGPISSKFSHGFPNPDTIFVNFYFIPGSVTGMDIAHGLSEANSSQIIGPVEIAAEIIADDLYNIRLTVCSSDNFITAMKKAEENFNVRRPETRIVDITYKILIKPENGKEITMEFDTQEEQWAFHAGLTGDDKFVGYTDYECDAYEKGKEWVLENPMNFVVVVS